MKRPDGGDWELGSGGFGQVYKALRHGVQPVAVKIIMVRVCLCVVVVGRGEPGRLLLMEVDQLLRFMHGKAGHALIGWQRVGVFVGL